MLNIKKFFFNQLRVCTYIAWDSKGKAVVVDPGMSNNEEENKFQEFIKTNSIDVEAILLTHGHFDHVYGVHYLTRIIEDSVLKNIYMNKNDLAILNKNHELVKPFHLEAADCSFKTTNVEHGDLITIGDNKYKVITTPGHSPGGVCYYNEEEQIIFTGDTLFAGCIGRSDFLLGDYDKLISGILNKLMTLDGDTKVFPGHGANTTIVFERTHNPFILEIEEKIKGAEKVE